MFAVSLSPETAGTLLSLGAAGFRMSARTGLTRRLHAAPRPVAAGSVALRDEAVPARAAGDPLSDLGILCALTPPSPVVETPLAPTPASVEALFAPARPKAQPARSVTVFEWGGVARIVDTSRRDGCRWPSGDPMSRGSDDFSYCDKPRLGGKSYCPEHCARAYQPQRSSARLPPRVA